VKNANRLFDRNDFDLIYARYFKDIIAAGSGVADPSGWARTEAETHVQLPSSARLNDLSSYIIDNRKLIAPQKEQLVSILGAWDRQQYAFDEITVTPSISSASFAVLLLLRDQGIKTIFVETPGYYVTEEQAASIGMRIRRIPTYHCSGYRVDRGYIRSTANSPVAVWLTQPRFALGLNQRSDDAVSLLQCLRKRDFLVIDETADQHWPTSLSVLKIEQENSNLIRIRGYMKPLGLNGLRLAFIIHPARYRSLLQEFQWIVGAALDYYSLSAAVQIASDPALFQSMLFAARNRILAIYRRLCMLAHGTGISLSVMENGYLGSAIVDWGGVSGTYASKRRFLLEYCKALKLPVTLGSAMLFARDPSREHVRLNYFMSPRDLEFCIKSLVQLRKVMTSNTINPAISE
jgi:histidinol-phosphate/aromatic aminotransferase/cobyric acid decarboxylase-like protein